MKHRILGPDKNEHQHGKFLGRLIRWMAQGLSWQGDTKLVEELVDEWGLKCAKSVVSPGVKENEETPWSEGTPDRRTKKEGATYQQRNKEAEEEGQRRGK